MATKKANLDIAQKLNITARRGDTFKLSVTFKDSGNNGIPVENYTYKLEVRSSASDDTADGAIISVVTTASDPTLTDGFDVSSTPALVINIPSSKMKDIVGGRYVYDLQADIGTSIQTWLKGNFVVNDDVTVN